MLIQNAEMVGADGTARRVDVHLAGGRIQAIGERLPTASGSPIVSADGGVLLPGLHDQHLHLRALAAAQASVRCGPPETRGADDLLRRLHAASAALPPGEWLRGIGYHPRVAGELDRHWLDRHGPSRPLRIQHRGGRCWIFNSSGLRALGVDPDAATGDDPLERVDRKPTGRLFDADGWLRSRLPNRPPSLAAVSARLARLGVTAVTDATPRNNAEEFAALAAAQDRGELGQDVVLMGDASLDGHGEHVGHSGRRVIRGATKFHLHDADLVDFDGVVDRVRRSHRAGRAAAFHCVTRGELAFALAALDEAGCHGADRIEHASVTPPELLDSLVRLQLKVIVQPNFVGERGDAYLDEVEVADRPWLYRLQGLRQAGLELAGSTDAPFGDADPWAAMRSAVARRTTDGRTLGLAEALTPEQALKLFSATARGLRVGDPADLCLLDRPWSSARKRLQAQDVVLTLKNGRCTWKRDDGPDRPVIASMPTPSAAGARGVPE